MLILLQLINIDSVVNSVFMMLKSEKYKDFSYSGIVKQKIPPEIRLVEVKLKLDIITEASDEDSILIK